MRATDGRHFAGLDHLRALAAFLLVFWHFAHRPDNQPVPLAQAPELALLDEGHVGVALFMTLSGYLFAKLIGDRPIHFGRFMANRLLRQAPLLVLVLLLYGLLQHRQDPLAYLVFLAGGLFLPTGRLGPGRSWSSCNSTFFYR